MFVTAVVLAAGESRRMGGQKLLLPFGESTILETVVGSVAASGADETIVVLGHRAGKVAPRLEGLPVRTVINPRYREGMSASIAAGVRAASPQAAAVMLVLADQPLTGAGVMGCILDGFRQCGKGIAVPVYEGRRGHPVVISLRYREELMALEGDVGARSILARHGGDVHEVAVASPGIYTDIDTEADYKASPRPGAPR